MAQQKQYRSPLRYPGGKSKALQQIVPLLPKGIHEYREPMVGGGSVFLTARSLRLSESYWINDTFSDLYVFWQNIQNPATCRRLRTDLEEIRQGFDAPAETRAFFLHAREEQPADDYRGALLFSVHQVMVMSTGATGAGSSRSCYISVPWSALRYHSSLWILWYLAMVVWSTPALVSSSNDSACHDVCIERKPSRRGERHFG